MPQQLKFLWQVQKETVLSILKPCVISYSDIPTMIRPILLVHFLHFQVMQGH